MSKSTRKTRKGKGQIALFYPKWYLCTKANPTRPQRQASAKNGGKSK